MSPQMPSKLSSLVHRWLPGPASHVRSFRVRRMARAFDRSKGLEQLTDRWIAAFGCGVSNGSFRGMAYVPEAVGSSLLPKLIGSYEQEITPAIEEMVAKRPPRIIDIGAAEGYYAVGLAL